MKLPHLPSIRRSLIIAGSLACSSTLGFSQTVWDAASGTDFLWSNAANWGGTEPDGLSDVILPKPIPNPGTLTDPNIITLSAGEQANSLSFFAPYTLTGGTLALTTGQIAVTIGNASTIESQLTGSGGLLKLNDGALKLTNAANDYTGTTQIDAGSVIITHQGALGTDASAIIVTGNVTRGAGGGSLVIGSGNNNLDGMTFTRDLALTGGGASGDGAAFNSAGNNVFTGNIVTGGNVAGLNPVLGTAITASSTRLASTFGTATLNGNLTVDPSGQSTEFTGNGNWLINSSIDGAGNVIKSGNGLMVLTGNNTFGGVLQLSGGYTRVFSQANLGGSLANNGIFLTNSGRLEIRTDTPDFTTAKRVQLNTGTTTGYMYLDREIGGSGLNQTVNLGLFTLGTSTGTRTLNIDGRNGYNLQFNGNMATAGQGSFTINNTGNGLFTNSGNFWSTNRTTASTLSFGNNGDFLITGGIIATGAAHVVTKTGTGTLTLSGTNSSFSGNLNVNGGTVAINDFRAVTNNTSVIDIGTGTTTATLSIIGNNLSGANVTTNKVINLGGTTGGAIILANQTGTSPGVRFNADFTATGGAVGNAKTVTLGGSSAQDNTIVGSIPNNNAGGTVNLLKIDSGTWVLAGANTYTGTTTITSGILKLEANGVSSTILPATADITFGNNNVNAGGTLEFVGQAGVNNVQALDVLTTTSGASTIRLNPGLLGTASLTFASQATGSAGTVNFVGADFTNNTITIPGADGLISRTNYWNGADFAYREGGVLRAPVYGTDAGFVTSSSALTAASNNEVTSSFATDTVSITTLKFNGGQTLTLNGGQTLTLSGGGLLATGGNSVITGGTALALGTQALVARVDSGADALRIESIITGSGGLTKSGAGVLVLTGVNAQTGTVTINEGTIRLADSGRLGAAAALTMRQGATLDLNGVTPSTNTNAFNSNGTITNSSATPVTFTVGGGNGTGTSNGLIEDGVGQVSVTKVGSGAQTWNMLSTYTGVTTIGSTGIVTTPNLANIGSPSSLGAGDAASDATNAASLVFNGASATQAFGGISYNGRASISTDRLFTFGGTAANSGARIQANGANDSTLIFSNTGALSFGTPNIDQGLVLGGASTGSNQFNPQITDNGTGVVNLYKADAGLWILGNSANSYTGITQVNAGALRGEGTTLPTASPLVLNGGVFQGEGLFTRSLTATPTAGAGGVSWTGAGGFAAATDKMTVNINGDLSQLTWNIGGFVPDGSNLILSSTTAFAEVEILNPINLNGAARTIQVDTNPTTNSDQATLTGVISGGAGSGITKTGGGILRLLGDNTFSGDTAINGGTVRTVNLGDSTSTASNFGTGAGKITLNNATLAYVGSGETSDRLIELGGTTSNVFIESSGTGPLILSNVKNVATGTAARTFFLRGDLNAANEITSALDNGAGTGALNVTKDDNGTWILSGQSTFTGNMTVSAGPLGIGDDSIGAVGAVTSSPVGTTRLIISNGSVFALNGDRTINTLTRFNGNASSNFIGINSLTLNSVETTSGGNTTVTNMLPTGKFLTINSPTYSGTETATARTFVFNGSGDTILNASVTNGNGGSGGVVNLLYQGYGSLTLGGSNGASTYTGATTISSGTIRLGSADAIPSGTGKGDVVMNPGTGLTATLDLNGFDQTINGLTANSLGTANIDNSSASPVTFTFGSQDSAATLIGGVTNSGGGALSLNKIGTGPAILNQGPFTYTGTTTVAGGSLIIAADVTSTTGLTVGPNAFLAFTEGLSGSAGITSIDVGAGGELRFLNSTGEPLSNLTSLTLGAGSTLGLNAGATSDTLTLLTGNVASVGGAVGLRIRDTGSMLGGTTYNLLEAASGGLTTGGTSNGSYSLTAIPGGFTTLTLNQTDTLVSLTTGTLVSDIRYWTGNAATGSKTEWNNVNGTFDGLNWSPDKDGVAVSAFVPGSGTTVVFNADNAPGGALVTTLEQGFRINALEFESSTGGATSVAIDPGSDPLNRLIISPGSSTDGINLKTGGPGTVSISAPLRVDVDQTWTVADSTSTLTLSGGLGGPGALTIDGSGTVFVTAAAGGTFGIPTVVVNGGTLETQNIASLGSTIVGNAAAVTVNSGAAFYYNGASGTVTNDLTLAGGTLSGGGGNPTYSGAVNVSADSAINLRNSNGGIGELTERTITLTGPLTGNGKLTLDSTAEFSGGNQFNGLLLLTNNNSGWSGGFDINRGTVRVQTNVDSFGTGDVTATAGRIQFNMPANNTVNLGQNFTVDAPGGLLELSVDAQSTLSGDLTVNLNGVVTLGSNANANNALRITQSSDNFSVLNITNSVVLGNDASISYQGNAVRPFEIAGVISETGGARSLAINDELGGWAVTSRTIVLSGANTFSGDLSLTEGALQFSTASNIGGGPSNLGQGSNITLAGGTFDFIGGTSQSTNRSINQTGAATFAANGTGGATITYAGNVSSGGNAITLTGTGVGIFSGAITQTGTAADINVNSGTWTFSGTGSTIADDIFVNATSTGTAVLNLNATGTLAWTPGTSNGLYARNGGVINLNADDVNGVDNSGNLSFILLGQDTNGDAGVLNTNTFNIETPRLDLGNTPVSRTGIITGTGTVSSNYAGTDYAQGFRLYAGSISAGLAGQAAILKTGVETVTLSGDNSGLIGTVANTRVDAGTLILDYTASNTIKLPSNRAVDMRGSTIQIVGNNTAATSETFNNLTLASGGSSEIQVTGGTGQDAVLNLGAITRGNRASDGTMRFILPTGAQTATHGIRTTSANSTFGLLGSGTTATADSAYATVDDGTGVWFATKNTTGSTPGNVVALISTAKDDVTTWLPGDHITDSAGFSGTLVCANINSLRFDSAAGSDLVVGDGVNFTIGSGGILLTSNVGNSPTIIGGNLVSGAGEIIVTHDSAVTFEISSNIRGLQAVTKTGTGTLLLTGNNTYTDETEIQEGTLQVNGTSIGDTSPVNLADDHVATLQLLNSEAIGRLTGGVNTAGLDTLATVDIGVHILTLNSGVGNATYAGKISGSGTLVKNNSGTNTNQAFSGASTDFNGMVIVNGGLFLFNSIGAMNATDYTLNSGSSLLLDNNGTTTTGARILDTATITLNSADGAWSGETRPSGLAIRRNQNSALNETVGVITVRSGSSYARLEATGGTSSVSQLIANDIVRQNNATLNVRGSGLGNTTGQRTQLRINDTTKQTAFIAAMVGGGGAAGSTNVNIVPWAIGETVAGGVGDGNMGNSLVTYVSGAGFRPLNLATEYATIAGAGATDNARQSLNADLTGIGGTTLNSLVLDNNNAPAAVNVTGSGVGHALANTSGAFLFTVTGGTNNTAYSTVLGGFDDGITVGGTNEYVFTVQNPSSATTTPTLTATVSSPLTSSADITKSGRGTLIFTAVNTAGGGSNKTTLNEGVVEIGALDNIGGATGEIVFAGGALRLGGSFTDDASTRSLTFLNGGGTIDTNGASTSLGERSGLGDLTKMGAGTLTLTGTADTAHQGRVIVRGGTLELNQTAGTAAIGSGGISLIAGVNPTTVTLSQSEQIDNSAAIIVESTGSNGAVFNLNGNTETVGAVTITGTTTNGSVLQTGTAGTLVLNGDLTFNNNRNSTGNNGREVLISGTGTRDVVAVDSGTLDLGGVNRMITVNRVGTNANMDATIETIIINGGIIKEGTQTLNLTGTNTYSGPTVINDGAINISSAANLGDGSATNAITIRNGATLASSGASVILGQAVQFDGSGATVDVSGGATNALVFTGVISGHDCAPLTKTGVGALALTNANTYEGGTNVSGGSLIVANTTGSATGLGQVTIQSSTVLGGDGFIAPAANQNVNIDGSLLVGDPTVLSGTDLSIVTSGTGLVTLGGSSTTTFDIWSGVGSGMLNGAGAADLLVLGGTNGIMLGGTLEVVNSSGFTNWTKFDSWQIVDWTTLSGGAEAPGMGSNVFTTVTLPMLTAGFVWDTSALYSGGIITVVPEPGRMMLLGFGLMVTLLRRRR